MQLRYVYTELGQGLRRNLSMHLAVILTLFVSLTLVGMGVLFQQQATKAAEQWGNQLQITVFLCRNGDSNPVCPSAVTDAQKAEIEAVVKDNPEVADYHFESSETALEKAKELYGEELFCERRLVRAGKPLGFKSAPMPDFALEPRAMLALSLANSRLDAKDADVIEMLIGACASFVDARALS